AIDLPAPRARAGRDRVGRADAGARDGAEQSGLGVRAHPWRVHRPWIQDRAVDGLADPPERRHRSRAPPVGADLASVPAGPGQDDPGGRLLRRRYRVPAPPVPAGSGEEMQAASAADILALVSPAGP